MLRHCAALLAAGLTVSGCATDPFKAISQPGLSTSIELGATPFFPQEDYQCGPAALATILAHSGVSLRPEELIPKVYIPARRGSLQPEMLAASREYERIPYVIAPEFPALLAEVAHGRPVLVLQNLGIGIVPAWHYAVVVGYSRERSELILRSGTDRRRVTAAGVFARTWARSGNWGIVALRPGELPATDDGARFLRAVAAAEAAGRIDLADDSYFAAAERWPHMSLVWFALGNSAYARGEADVAEHFYRRALQLDATDAATLNNLASSIAAQGRCGEARQVLQTALALTNTDVAMEDVLVATKADVEACR